MAGLSNIEWTEATWNPVTGCTKITDGCLNCYAATMAKRLEAMGNIRYQNGFNITLHPDLLDKPLKWKKPKKIFVNSMSDLFHEEVPDQFIKDVFKTMNDARQHIFQVLTKRPHRAAKLSNELNWSDNIWIGTSVENEKVLNRIKHLKKIPAIIRFLSCEPLLAPINNLDLTDIQWVIVGGESGPGARPMEEKWVLDIKNECAKQQVAFFFKQWGGVQKHKNGRTLEGKLYDEFPKIDKYN